MTIPVLERTLAERTYQVPQLDNIELDWRCGAEDNVARLSRYLAQKRHKVVGKFLRAAVAALPADPRLVGLI
jgi:hypothetical protein